MSSKDKSGRKSHQRKSKHQAIPVRSESIARIRSSRYARFSRYSELGKTEEDDFHIRKALNVYVREELQLQGRKTYFQRVFILARNLENPEPEKQGNKESVYSAAKGAKQRDYRVIFQKQMDKILATCERNKCTQDSLSGLFVCMDVFSYLMIEGSEDMVANFFSELALIHDVVWMESKVFMVEDNIGETYFSVLHSRRSPGININEKFPPSTTSDPALMSVQHLKLREKITKLALTFADQIKLAEDTDIENNTLLPADPYNKLLPEIQRIELVLKAHKFYRNVKDFALTYTMIPTHQDEEALFWPIQDNYTPLNIFERSEFDVNLTFADYGNTEALEEEPRESTGQEEK